ncbi:hypothetical protein VT84_09545 [Gemmata sp. SH-PL17]|uniref:hypothetical protein n=1 Tax=Gemmata sp. SH-PL17 TaxID=1630693 RepID=UPI00078CA3BA|nr:hypothetical protein [Gemmata sp. SH-PL17]AMV24628.1 hypothetical protein VT84_09545 [Gemmata sp. SH-PL17]
MIRFGPLVRLVTVGLFAAILFAGIAVALQMCVRLPRAVGAPLPPPPKLSAEILVGKWAYDWDEKSEGTIWVYPDGSYCSILGGPSGGTIWHGTWEVRDGVLHLTEWAFNPDNQGRWGPIHYRVAISMKRYPRLVGSTQYGNEVVLRDPVR